MSSAPNPLPDYDAGVLAAALGLDPHEVTSMRVHIEARWISLRWSGYKRVTPAELQHAIDKATEAAKAAAGDKPAARRTRKRA